MIRVLDEGLDEVAAGHHQGSPLRWCVTGAVAVLCLFLLPTALCVDWLILAALMETWSWFATRNQFKGRAVGTAVRLHHLGSHIGISFCWMGLGLVLWNSGTFEGTIFALAIWLSVIFYSQAHAYQSTSAFVGGGLGPALFMLAAVWLAPNPLHLNLPLVSGVLALAVGFAGDGVLRMLKARKHYRASLARTAESDTRYRVLAANITDVIALTGMDGQRIYISPSIEAALGYSVDFLLSQPNYRYLHEDDRERVTSGVASLREPGETVVIEYRVIRADGSPLWVETNFSVAENAVPGGPPQIVSVSRVTERRKELDRQLIEARERAEQAAAAKSDFLANMTHELRTPLNAIIGFSGLLKGSSHLNKTDARSAKLIHDASATLLEIVNSVLDFSKFEAGAVELDAQPFNAADEAQAVVALVGDQAADKGLTLEVVCDGADEALMGDAPRLRQVLLNFLSNALKFTGAGGVTLSVRQTPSAEGCRTLRVEVSDTGIGVPAEQLEQVFERFTQGDVSVSRRFGGTGLGLAICKRIIEMMDGQIGATSVEGEGSTFWFEIELPIAGRAALPQADDAPVELGRPVKLLLVEDVAVNRELVQALLKPFEIEIDTACDGAQGVYAAEQTAYDLILMDVQMPVMDGLTAARRIRSGTSPHARTVPIVAMTANVLPEQIRKCLDAGMNDHLGKPISPARLLEAIARWTMPGAQAEPVDDLEALVG